MRKWVKHVAERLDGALPDQLELSSSRDLLAERARRWRWPAFQMFVAGALAYLAADKLGLGSASYAPIAAIGALGLGRERRLSRSAMMLAGLSLGVVAAEIATPLIGVGWWQIGVLVGLTALAAGALVDRDLAVTYAVINVIVLVTLPGNEGWVPDRLLSGALGVSVAVAIVLLVLPPRPVRIVSRRLCRSIDLAGDALEETADTLRRCRDGAADDDLVGGDDRRLIAASRRLDREIERSHDSADQAAEISRWSPARRRDTAEVERLRRVAAELRPALRTVSTIARLGDRSALIGVAAGGQLIDAVEQCADAVRELARHIVDDDAPDDERDRATADVVERLLDEPASHAILIAMQEEVRGLIADLADSATSAFDEVAHDTTSSVSGREVDGITFGG